jgi:membrane-bound lytic murein transglycosylase B
MSEAKFLPKVIEYDRYQPEFYEDTLHILKKDLPIEKLKKD